MTPVGSNGGGDPTWRIIPRHCDIGRNRGAEASQVRRQQQRCRRNCCQTAFLAIADILYRRANLEHAAASLTNLTQSGMLILLLSIPFAGCYDAARLDRRHPSGDGRSRACLHVRCAAGLDNAPHADVAAAHDPGDSGRPAVAGEHAPSPIDAGDIGMPSSWTAFAAMTGNASRGT
jgi:hypothetical protein